MNSLHSSLPGPREQRPEPSDFEQQLRAFFRAEMPTPWPTLQPPAAPFTPRSATPPRLRSLLRSRLTLAASLLILLLGQIVVARLFTSSVPFATGTGRGGIEATRRHGGGEPAPAGATKGQTGRRFPAEGMLNSGRR